MKQTTSSVYLQAMKIVDENKQHSCIAICDALNEFYSPRIPEVQAYAALFKPKHSYGCYWLNQAYFNGLIEKRDFVNWRLTALAFMHAITTYKKKPKRRVR